MTDWTLCIDFGTAYSKAAAAPAGAWASFDPSEVRPLMLSAHEPHGNPFLLESALFVDDQRVLFGRAALARADELAISKRMALRSFKTLLSVSDLERALNTNAPLAVDPHRVFQLRDLIVLYLAYLLTAVERAAKADPLLAKAVGVSRRYAAPAWRSGDSTGMHATIARLFGEAEAFRAAIGKDMLARQGLSLKDIRETLERVSATARPVEMGLIFEATAAAAYSSIGLDDTASHFIVVDMGAGTTDIAALVRLGPRMVELPEVRVTLKHAGDFVDRVIANRILQSAPWARSTEQKTELWSMAMRAIGDIKETVFEEGRATLRYNGRNITLKMNDIAKEPDFRAFVRSLTEAYDHGLEIVRDDAGARRRSDVQAVAVGGGSGAPFIQELIRRKTKGGRPYVTPRPATPDWAHAAEFQGNLAPVFPQLAIAIGGALAPEGMLAVRADA